MSNYDRPPMPLPGESESKKHHLFSKLVNKFENFSPYNKSSEDLQQQQHEQEQYQPQQTISKTFSNSSVASDSMKEYDNNIFSCKIADDNPIDYFGSASHPLNLPNVLSNDMPIETNKFYGNLLLNEQTCTIWTNPYSFSYSRNDYFGLAAYYIEHSQRVFGPGNPAEYFLSPIGIKSIVLSAKEFPSKESVKMTMSNMKQFSCDLTFANNSNESQSFKSSLVQGMGFITSIYENLTFQINSIIGFKSFEEVKLSTEYSFFNIKKYKITLFNEKIWSLYICDYNNSDANITLNKVDNNCIQSDRPFSKVVIQLCCGYSEYYDRVAGTYTESIDLKAKLVDDKCANICFKFNYKGQSLINRPIMWAYPHHVESFTKDMETYQTNLELDSTIFGKMKAYIHNKFEFEEPDLPVNINFEPWTNLDGFNQSKTYYDANNLSKINAAAEMEIDDDVENFSNLDSMYFSGKQLDKYAFILYVCYFVLKDNAKTQKIMEKLQKSFDRFIKNQQIQPLVYDTKFKGLISRAGLGSDPNLDFGNSYYNDHHFHYGYFVHAAAIIVLVEKTMNNGNSEWLNKNGKYINFLVRDFANSSEEDKYFPVFRSFDWFAGHSFAKGLFESADGKDQESFSEDYHAIYGCKLWGKVTNNQNLETRSNIQLAILRRVCNNYVFLKKNNKNLPPNFIDNKVPGILFENKYHHATYFGANLEYIQGIQMIPTTPISSYYRDKTFVQEEWDGLLKNHIDKVNDGWKGILMLNTALMDPKFAWNFFAQDGFNRGFLDGGMSLTWSLAYIAGIGGSA